MANPFAVVDPIEAMVGTQKSLASIGLADAQAEQVKAHTNLYNEQARLAKAKAEKEQGIQEALKGVEPTDPATLDPFTGGSEKSQYKNTLAGEVPIFLRLVAKAQDYDKQAQVLRTRDFDAYMKVAKERDNLFEKAASEQNKWLDDTRKQMGEVDALIGSIEGAPSYNIVAEQLKDRFGPEALKRNGLPDRISQEEFESPEIQDKIATTRRQLLGVKGQLEQAEKKWRQDFDTRRQEDLEKDRNLRRQQEATRIGMERERIEISKTNKEDRDEFKDDERQRRVVEGVERSLRADPVYRNASYYENAGGEIARLRGLVYDDKGNVRKDWYNKLTEPDALKFSAMLGKMRSDFKDTQSTVYAEKQKDGTMGLWQKSEKFFRTIGEGDKQFDPGTMRDALQTMEDAYNINNTNIVKRELQAMDKIALRKGDPDQLMLKGNMAEFLRRNYNPKEPRNSFVNFAEKETEDGKKEYYIRVGTEQYRVTKRIYDYGRR